MYQCRHIRSMNATFSAQMSFQELRSASAHSQAPVQVASRVRIGNSVGRGPITAFQSSGTNYLSTFYASCPLWCALYHSFLSLVNESRHKPSSKATAPLTINHPWLINIKSSFLRFAKAEPEARTYPRCSFQPNSQKL